MSACTQCEPGRLLEILILGGSHRSAVQAAAGLTLEQQATIVGVMTQVCCIQYRLRQEKAQLLRCLHVSPCRFCSTWLTDWLRWSTSLPR